MNPFHALIAFGLAGLLAMVFPRLRRHGHGPRSGLKWLEPRALFSIAAAGGALGLLWHALGVEETTALLAGLAGGWLLERLVISRLWRWLLRFQARPSSSLDALVLEPARAVTRFRNGKGIVAVERDGREVQFRAQLVAAEVAMSVDVGARLRVVEVQSSQELLWVSSL